MEKNKNTRAWYVYTTDVRTNRIIFSELDPTPDPCHGYWAEDLDHIHGRKMEVKINLVRLDSYEQIKLLRSSHKEINLYFHIFVQDSPGGKIYRWPFDKSLRKVKRSSK